MNREAVRRPLRARVDGEVRDGGDGGQRLPAKAQRPNVREIAVGNLGGGVAFNREDEIVLVHAASIVDHADEFAAAVLDRHVDALRAGVERVFDQLLDGGTGPFDYFAGGDAVDEDGIETANGHERFFFATCAIIQRMRRELTRKATRNAPVRAYLEHGGRAPRQVWRRRPPRRRGGRPAREWGRGGEGARFSSIGFPRGRSVPYKNPM